MMDRLMVELVGVILGHVDEVTLPWCRFVSRAWNALTRRVQLEECPAGSWTPPNYTQVLASEGRLRMLAQARAHGCPWASLTVAKAAGAGHLDVVHWLQANGCPLQGRGYGQHAAITLAARHGHMEVRGIPQWPCL